MWQPFIGLIFAAAGLIEARKVQRSLDLHRYRHAAASFIGAAACITIAEEALRGDWVHAGDWNWHVRRGESCSD